MKLLARCLISLFAFAAIGCATTTTTAPAQQPVASCAELDWHSCAVAKQCQHGRWWTEQSGAMQETWVCEARYAPMTTARLQTASK